MFSDFNRAVEVLYDCALSPEKWPDALTGITQCFGGTGTGLFFRRKDAALSVINSPGLLDVVSAQYVAEGWNARDLRDMRAQESNAWGTSATLSDRDLVTREEMNTHPYYTDFLAPHGLRWFLTASVSPDPDLFVVLSVQRSPEQGEFSEHDREILVALSLHAEKALRLSGRLMQAELSNIALGEALKRLGCGVVLVDKAGLPIFANAKGEGFVPALRSGASAAGVEIAALTQEIRRVIEGGLARDVGKDRPILLESGGRRTASYVIPASEGARSVIAEALSDFWAIVLFVEQSESEPVDPSIVRDFLGVTLGEARVASLIGAGLSPRETASSLGITEETARTVLKRVFTKLNVSRQSQLAVLLSELSRTQLR